MPLWVPEVYKNFVLGGTSSTSEPVMALRTGSCHFRSETSSDNREITYV